MFFTENDTAKERLMKNDQISTLPLPGRAQVISRFAVALTKLVDKLFFFPRITQSDLVGELEQAAHVGGLNTDELMAGSVCAENIIENFIIDETFGNDNLEVALCGTRFAEIDACKRNVNQNNEYGKDDRNCNITHACCKADSHCEEDTCYFTRGSGGGTETDKAESTCNSNTCAELSVNKGDNRLNYHRQKHKGDRKALGGTISVSTANGDENAQCKRTSRQTINPPAVKVLVVEKILSITLLSIVKNPFVYG